MRNLTAVFNHTVLIKVGLVSLGLYLPIVLQNQPTIAAEVYKIELKETSQTEAYTLKGESLKKVRGQSEWVVLTVNESNVVQFKHMRRTANSYGVSKWAENSVATLIACPIASGDCKNTNTNRFEIPRTNTIKDFRFEFQFLEGNIEQVRSVQVPSDRIPETQPKPINRSRSNGR